MLVLLLAETDIILKEKYYKTNIAKFFCSVCDKIVFALLTEVVTGYLIINPINVRKTYFEKTFARTFYSHGSGFYYSSNNILRVFICINL